MDLTTVVWVGNMVEISQVRSRSKTGGMWTRARQGLYRPRQWRKLARISFSSSRQVR